MTKETANKFNKIYAYIKDNIHFCNNDFSLNKNNYNTAVLTGMLTSLVNGKMIYVGEYGQGKTTLSEVISSLMFSIPPVAVEASSVKGHPELTNEQLVGRIDLGLYSQGIEKTIWSDFVFSKSKIIDELNRIPEHKQNILLMGMQSGMWKNLSEYVQCEEGPWFATMNYKDKGNNGIVPPLLDRFDISVEAKSPGINNMRLITYANKISFDYPDIDFAYASLMGKKGLTYQEYVSEMSVLKNEFRERTFRDKGLELFTNEELNEIQEEIKSKTFKNNAMYFLDVIFAELGTCQHYEEKRTTDICPEDCHFSTYACKQTKNSISVRTIQAVNKYSKAISWLDNKSEVDTNHVQSILPLTLWHKLEFDDDLFSKYEKKGRTEPAKLATTNAILGDITKRSRKILSAQKEVVGYMLSNQEKEAKKKADSMDHPVFAGYLK